MKHNTTTATKAAKATATKVNTTAKAATTAATDVVTLTADELTAAAKDVAKGCATCKDVAAKFAAVVDMYGKGNAVAIQAAAKQIVKDTATATKVSAADGREFLSNGANVAAAAWRDLLSADRVGAVFAKVVFDNCGRDLATVVTRYASYVTTKDGAAVAIVKITDKDADGHKTTIYKPRNLATVGGYLSALKLALNNAKRAALGHTRDKWQNEIAADAVTWPDAE